MDIFGNGIMAIKGVPLLLFSVLVIVALGYALGRITIKGINLGTAGVFLVALLFGATFYGELNENLSASNIVAKDLFKIIENLGLILFVTSVGFIAGPKFFGNLKRNFKSYVLLGVVIILSGGIAAALCIVFGHNVLGYGAELNSLEEFTAMMTGLLSGALTSTPAFSAAKEAVGSEHLQDIVSAGYGIAYIFGVLGVVLFVQLMPKFARVNMDEERAKITSVSAGEKKEFAGKIIKIDDYGLAPFAFAAVLGMLLGAFKIPLTGEGWSTLLSGGKLTSTAFNLTTTGGCLLVALIFGHFRRIGVISIMPDEKALKVFREFGLMLFLIGAGVPGGSTFVQNFDPMYFVYGIVITLLPMIMGFLFAKYVLKLSFLNNLGSICGGMTSTPALGTLINTAKTEDIASAYAATYPIALIAVVLVAQLLIIIFR